MEAGVLARQVEDCPQPVGVEVAEEVGEAEAAAEGEEKGGEGRGGAAAGETDAGQVHHRREGERQQRAAQHQRAGQAGAERNQGRRQKVDRKRVGQVVARVEGQLGREVGAVGEGAGVAEVRGPVGPGARGAGIEPVGQRPVGVREEAVDVDTGDQGDRRQRPGMVGGGRPPGPASDQRLQVRQHPVPAAVPPQRRADERDGDAAPDAGEPEAEGRGEGEPGQGDRHRSDHRAEEEPLLEAELEPTEVAEPEAADQTGEEEQRGRSDRRSRHCRGK